MRKLNDDSMMFIYNILQAGYFGFGQYGGYVKFSLEFKLKINNVSLHDVARYECRLSFPFIIQLITASKYDHDCL